jgi:prevent-host-death family protein
MKSVWALQDAKNKFSEVVDCAIERGPQVITRRGKDTAVLLSIAEFKKLTARDSDVVSFFRNSPLAGSGIVLDRDPDTGRNVDL